MESSKRNMATFAFGVFVFCVLFFIWLERGRFASYDLASQLANMQFSIEAMERNLMATNERVRALMDYCNIDDSLFQD